MTMVPRMDAQQLYFSLTTILAIVTGWNIFTTHQPVRVQEICVVVDRAIADR